jgi:hypothetical protein
MPRKSAASNIVSLAATTPRPVLTPIGLPLSKPERAFFDFVARTNNHLKVSDSPMVMLLAVSIVRAMKARSKGGETFEKELRAALAVARSLRVTVQATMHPITAGRRRAESGLSYYDRMNLEEEH